MAMDGAGPATEGAADDPLAAVRTALARHAWQDAFDAVRSASFDDAGREADRLDLEADAAWWLGRLDECIAAREAAYRTFDELGDDRRAGQCAVWLWEHHGFAARPSVAGAWLRRARRALDDDTDCVEHGNLLLREAETAHGQGDLERGFELATAALGLGRRLRSTDLEAEALQTQGRILIDQGRIDDGMGHLDEAMLFAVEGRLRPFSAGKVYCSLIAACEAVGDLDRAAEWTAVTERWASRHPFAIFPGLCRVHRAVLLKQRGDLEAAEHEAVRACQELRQSHLAITAAAWAEVGDIRRRLGQLDEAEEAFTRARELCGAPCGSHALLLLAQGRPDEALSTVTSCVAGRSNPLARAELLPMVVQISLAAGDPDGSRRALAELQGIATSFDLASLAAAELLARGRIELAEADPGAPTTLRQAAEAWGRLGIPYEEATARTLLGQALTLAGDAPGASESFQAAARIFDQVGACLGAGSVEPPVEPDLPDGLTAREVEVLRLVAAGLTNNEIAVELFLSAKTVSRHLSNIFAKIGVSSRAAATAYAFEHDLVAAKP